MITRSTKTRFSKYLAVAAALAVLGPISTARGEVVAAFNPLLGEFPEGIALDHQRNLYVSFPPIGEVRRIAPDGTQTILATLEIAPDNFLGVLGLAVDTQNIVYAAAPSGADATHGIVRISPEGEVQRIPGSEAMFFPNAVTLAPNGTLYATESSGQPNGGGFEMGAVWRAHRDGPAEVWLRHEALTGTDSELVGVPFPLGANGIAYSRQAVYVVNTEQMHIVRIPVLPNGLPGDPEIVKSFTGTFDFMDGIAADNVGNLYTVFPALNTLIQISRDGSVNTLATAADHLDFPAGVTAGEVQRGRRQIYVTSFAIGPFPGGGPNVVRVDRSPIAPTSDEAFDGDQKVAPVRGSAREDAAQAAKAPQSIGSSAHIASVSVRILTRPSLGARHKTEQKYAEATVVIVNDSGDGVPGAAVKGSFTGNLLRRSQTVSGTTDQDGVVTLTLTKSVGWDGSSPLNFTFCVVHVDSSPSWDGNLNGACDSESY